MAYLSLYRKYRSQGFNEIMGQKHVTQTLQNAIRRGRIGHAYLFCGPRGTGKTSTARILAKALNCEHGPTPDPCNTCEACLRVTGGHSLDVLEIDAASNRGIDEIRELREQVGRASAQERYKFYIIDEVHQLTGDAFNALLKTLEEPPPQVVFVLATTEYQKVPATIVSRCQRFDFKRGSHAELIERLCFVAEAEGVALEPEAAALLARGATGSWRDALSLLEQVMAFAVDHIGVEEVTEGLGLIATSLLLEMGQAVADRRPDKAFEAVDGALSAGREPRQVLSSLCALFRDLLRLSSLGAGAVGASDTFPGYAELAARFEPPELVWALETMARAESQMRLAGNQRLALELPLVKLCLGPPSAPVATEHSAAEHPEPQPPRSGAPKRPEEPAQRPTPRPAPEAVVATPQEPALEEPPPPLLKPPAEPDSDGVSLPVGKSTTKGSRTKAAAATPAAPPQADEDDGEAPSGPSRTVTLDEVQRRWAEVIQKVRRPSVVPLVRDAMPQKLEGSNLLLRVKFQGHADVLARQENRQAVEKAVEAALGAKVRLRCEAGQMALGDLSSDPELKQICEMFEGELVEE